MGDSLKRLGDTARGGDSVPRVGEEQDAAREASARPRRVKPPFFFPRGARHTAVQPSNVSGEAYLVAEQTRDIRPEDLGGLDHARAGETRAHTSMGGNLAVAIRQHRRGGPCKRAMSDLRVNLHLGDDAYFSDPDRVVSCDPHDTDRGLVRHARRLSEGMSPRSGRVDQRERVFASTPLDALEGGRRVAQNPPGVTRCRRGEGWCAPGAEARQTWVSPPFALSLAAIEEGH